MTKYQLYFHFVLSNTDPNLRINSAVPAKTHKRQPLQENWIKTARYKYYGHIGWCGDYDFSSTNLQTLQDHAIMLLNSANRSMFDTQNCYSQLSLVVYSLKGDQNYCMKFSPRFLQSACDYFASLQLDLYSSFNTLSTQLTPEQLYTIVIGTALPYNPLINRRITQTITKKSTRYTYKTDYPIEEYPRLQHVFEMQLQTLLERYPNVKCELHITSYTQRDDMIMSFIFTKSILKLCCQNDIPIYIKWNAERPHKYIPVNDRQRGDFSNE